MAGSLIAGSDIRGCLRIRTQGGGAALMIRRGLFDSAARKGWRQAGLAAKSFADKCIYGFQSTVIGGHEHSVFQTGGSCTRPDRTLDDDDQVAADVRRG
jgi:hypothetical protein